MSIKQESVETSVGKVWSGGVLEVKGRDAGAFLQAQLMNDVRALQDGDWQWTGWLTPKGRVVALALLRRESAERHWLLLPDYPAARLAQDLQRFVFRSKLELVARDDLGVYGTTGQRLSDAGSGFGLALGGESPRMLWVDASGPAPGLALAAEPWAVADLAHGLPRLGPGTEAAHTPQMLGLERLRAYSVKKGCYPGQEIVARTHFLGQAKRVLHRLVASQPVVAGDSLHDEEGRSVGEVLCAASFEGRCEALAVLACDGLPGALAGPRGVRLRVTEFAKGLGG